MNSEIKTINVEGMSCNHCVECIKKAAGSLNGVIEVSVDLKEGKVTLEYDPERIDLETIKDIIEDQGYNVKK